MSVSKLQSQLAQARNSLRKHQKDLDPKSFNDAKHGLNLAEKAQRELQSKRDRQDEEAMLYNGFVNLEFEQISDTELLDL